MGLQVQDLGLSLAWNSPAPLPVGSGSKGPAGREDCGVLSGGVEKHNFGGTSGVAQARKLPSSI